MKKKNALILCGSLFVWCATIALITTNNGGLVLKAEEVTYSITLDSTNAPTMSSEFVTATKGIQSSGDYTFNFDYSSVKSNVSGHAILNDGSTIVRSEQDTLNGVKSVKLNYTGGQMIAMYGMTSSGLHSRVIPGDGSETRFATDFEFNYFALKAVGEVSLEKAVINYSCNAASSPVDFAVPTVTSSGCYVKNIKVDSAYDEDVLVYIHPYAGNTINSVKLNGVAIDGDDDGFYSWKVGPDDSLVVESLADEWDEVTVNINVWDGTDFVLEETKQVPFAGQTDYFGYIEAPAVEGKVADKDYVYIQVGDTSIVDFYYTPIEKVSETPDAVAPSGTGAQNDPYLIASTANWVWFKAQEEGGNDFENKYFKLTTSLDFSLISDYHDYMFEDTLQSDSETLGIAYTPLKAHIDGNHCSIRGISVNDASKGYCSLLGVQAPEGSIKSITTYGSITASYNSGVLFYSVGGKVSDFYNFCTCSLSDTSRGLVGCVAAVTYLETQPNVEISECYNYAKISSSGENAGGILGSANAGTVTMENCNNFGEVTSLNGNGGIFGVSKTAKALVLNISNCNNYAKVSSSTKSNVGGIVGWLYTTKTASISNCENFGNVTAAKTAAGGIVGVGSGTIAISECFNFANITTVATADGNGCGGIIAYCQNLATTPHFTISHCANMGYVTSARHSAGGIEGWDNNDTTALKNADTQISYCYNFGTVSTPNQTSCGAIAGQFANTTGKSSISNCANYGTVLVKGTAKNTQLIGSSK